MVLLLAAASLASAEIHSVTYSDVVTFTTLGQAGTLDIAQWQAGWGTLTGLTVRFSDYGQTVFSSSTSGTLTSAQATIFRGYHVVGVGFENLDPHPVVQVWRCPH